MKKKYFFNGVIVTVMVISACFMIQRVYIQNKTEQQKASQEINNTIQKVGVFASKFVKGAVQGKFKTSEEHPLTIQISTDVGSLSDVSEEVDGVVISGKVGGMMIDTRFITATSESEGVEEAAPGSGFVKVSLDTLVMYLISGSFSFYGDFSVNGNSIKFLEGDIIDSTNGEEISFSSGTLCEYNGKHYIFQKGYWFEK